VPGFIGQYGWLMSAVKSAGLRLTGSAPVGSVDAGAEVLSAGLDSKAGVPGGVVAEGLIALLVHPAQSIVAARISGSVRRSIVEFLPQVVPCREHYSGAMKNR
jgi:hypothetical protein